MGSDTEPVVENVSESEVARVLQEAAKQGPDQVKSLIQSIDIEGKCFINAEHAFINTSNSTIKFRR